MIYIKCAMIFLNESKIFQGLIKETKLDHFNLPYYEPHARKVKKVIDEERSFFVHKLDTF